jgi:hypothetical protein
MSIKLSMTVRRHLERKYDTKALRAIDAALKRWIAADRKRGIRTVHVAVDDRAAMKALKATAVTGTDTAAKVKRALDPLVRRLAPDYVVVIGADDVVPYFQVENPSFDPDGDDDERVPTDNPYASNEVFRASRRSSYLAPDRVLGRIPDLRGSGDPSWLLAHLERATNWTSHPKRHYAGVHAICCHSWSGAGAECVQELSEKPARLMISPPQNDKNATHRSRLTAHLHMIKCHGAHLDTRYYGQKGNSYPEALHSRTLRPRVRPTTVAAAMCCYGAEVFAPDDASALQPGDWPIASTYLRRGAYGFVGSTTIAWVGDTSMVAADWVVVAYLKSVLGGASTGRALLEAKQDYLRWLQQQGMAPDVADEKTLLQFVLLGDPSIHPVAAPQAAPAVGRRGGPARRARAVRAVAAAGPTTLVAQERRQRRVFRAQLGDQLRRAAPIRTPAAAGARRRAPRVLAVARALLGKGAGTPRPLAGRARVERVEVRIEAPAGAPRAVLAARGPAGRRRGGVEKRESIQYSFSAGRRIDGKRDIRLVTVETDRQGRVLRSSVVVSS